MDRVAVFVDAGYLFASGAVLLTGEKLPRGRLDLQYDIVVTALEQFATRASGRPLLRIYWYDGTSTGPTPQHLALAYHNDVKVRLGLVNKRGEQKGVDTLIVTDMIELARNRAISDAVLVSGDEDVRVGALQAQEFGIRVHLLGVEPRRNNQSNLLVQEADTVSEWQRDDIEQFLSVREAVPAATPAVGPAPRDVDAVLSAVAGQCVAQLTEPELKAVLEGGSPTQVPSDIDRKLLGGSRAQLERNLEPAEKRAVRKYFFELAQQELESLP